jgi:hypothetical protein
MMMKGLTRTVVGLTLLLLGGLLAALFWPLGKHGRPPVLSLGSVEASGMVDDDGQELWLVTLSVSNPVPLGDAPLYLKAGTKRTQARVGSQWVEADAAMETLRLTPGVRRELQLLLPPGTESCRIWVQYTGALVARGRTTYLVRWLPSSIHRKLPARFWIWAGFVHYRPNSHWREVEFELPLRLEDSKSGVIK